MPEGTVLDKESKRGAKDGDMDLHAAARDSDAALFFEIGEDGLADVILEHREVRYVSPRRHVRNGRSFRAGTGF